MKKYPDLEEHAVLGLAAELSEDIPEPLPWTQVAVLDLTFCDGLSVLILEQLLNSHLSVVCLIEAEGFEDCWTIIRDTNRDLFHKLLQKLVWFPANVESQAVVSSCWSKKNNKNCEGKGERKGSES